MSRTHGNGPNQQNSNFGWVAGDAKEVAHVAQVENLVAEELTFRRLEFDDGAENTGETGAEFVEIVGVATRKHYYVVEKREADFGYEASQHDRDEMLIRRRGITKPEWNFYHFETFDVGNECSFVDVGGSNGH